MDSDFENAIEKKSEKSLENEYSNAASNQQIITGADDAGSGQNNALGAVINDDERTLQLKEWQSIANESPQVQYGAAIQKMADESDQVAASKEVHQMVNGQAGNTSEVKNLTGLPENLKAGVEQLSGYSMDDVKVHFNSSKPAQLQAKAYAQGSDIHVGPGQEEHLPHEAWHVVQQKEGRVQPTMQLKGNIPVNDEYGLEKEADVMGAKAMMANASKPQGIQPDKSKNFASSGIIQRVNTKKNGEAKESPLKKQKTTDLETSDDGAGFLSNGPVDSMEMSASMEIKEPNEDRNQTKKRKHKKNDRNATKSEQEKEAPLKKHKSIDYETSTDDVAFFPYNEGKEELEDSETEVEEHMSFSDDGKGKEDLEDSITEMEEWENEQGMVAESEAVNDSDSMEIEDDHDAFKKNNLPEKRAKAVYHIIKTNFSNVDHFLKKELQDVIKENEGNIDNFDSSKNMTNAIKFLRDNKLLFPSAGSLNGVKVLSLYEDKLPEQDTKAPDKSLVDKIEEIAKAQKISGKKHELIRKTLIEVICHESDGDKWDKWRAELIALFKTPSAAKYYTDNCVRAGGEHEQLITSTTAGQVLYDLEHPLELSSVGDQMYTTLDFQHDTNVPTEYIMLKTTTEYGDKKHSQNHHPTSKETISFVDALDATKFHGSPGSGKGSSPIYHRELAEKIGNRQNLEQLNLELMKVNMDNLATRMDILFYPASLRKQQKYVQTDGTELFFDNEKDLHLIARNVEIRRRKVLGLFEAVNTLLDGGNDVFEDLETNMMDDNSADEIDKLPKTPLHYPTYT